ncbi:hypothetical protein SARC_09075 [Sphaeroforma arctica JP610]|uniref:Uncharacterized protein n=1 Tax=Sphaeroforma arctica JP610 TaxID=667725 RepID=A0A0L0FPR4_9EUKA|nr:hypothetical protein SARC_09075 [Sphaeroforma arctica JP610]KNC78501.1 hypothetical protein SARC_09075 [Sphaeroforma arctica JP610]|eukprot:XP_014152403.1 hypothetical protein SARC_09075 [Sphaeroforma arctica JP610]
MWMKSALDRGVEDRDVLTACIKFVVPKFKDKMNTPAEEINPSASWHPTGTPASWQPTSTRELSEQMHAAGPIRTIPQRSTNFHHVDPRRAPDFMVDIGEFESPQTTLAGPVGKYSSVLNLAASEQLSPEDSIADAQAVVAHFADAPNADVSFQHFTAPVLSECQCATLMDCVEALHADSHGPITVHGNVALNANEAVNVSDVLWELTGLLDARNVEKPAALISNQYSEIKLRRVQANGQCIPFHMDHSRRTLQVLLNRDGADYIGGNIVYTTQAGFKTPVRVAGSATVHDNTIPHGVTQMREDVRYSLFFLDNYAGQSQGLNSQRQPSPELSPMQACTRTCVP